MVHVSDITAEKRINSPHDMLRVGQIVKAQVLAIDLEKRQMRLGMKQLIPTGIDEYLAEHNEGDTVTGRLMDDAGGQVGQARRTRRRHPRHMRRQRKARSGNDRGTKRIESRSFFAEFHAAISLENRLRRPA